MIQARIRRHFSGRGGSASFGLDIDLEVPPGITVLFGPSGSGKTLTLDCIAGFSNPDTGRILIDDAIVFDSGAKVSVRPQERGCGYVFQSHALFPHMTLKQNLAFAATRWSRTEGAARIKRALEQFRLTDVAGRRPQQVSGGQQQRCSIARALISEPRILLLDEPAGGLDAPLRADFYAIVRQIRSDYDTPILLVTHSLHECLELGDRMVVLHAGKILQQGTPSEVCSRPASVDLAHLLGTFNVLPVEIQALDPSRNSSLLLWRDFTIQSEYWPGHFNGDHARLLATPQQLRAVARSGRLAPNQIPAQLLRTVALPHGVRLEFAEGIFVELPDTGNARNNGEWAIEFPVHGLRML